MAQIKIALMGRPRSGKDHLADRSGLPKYRIGENLYTLMKKMFPVHDQKSLPGYISTIKTLGQWGRACINEEYPLTPERALMEDHIRNSATRWQCEYFQRYGLREDFWVEGFYLKFLIQSDPRYSAQFVGNPHGIVVDLRDAKDLSFLRERGFEIYLVLCDEGTRRKRIHGVGESRHWGMSEDPDPFSEHLRVGIVEYLNTLYSNYFLYHGFRERDEEIEAIFEKRVIWNDDQEMPNHPSCISVDDFLADIHRRGFQAPDASVVI